MIRTSFYRMRFCKRYIRYFEDKNENPFISFPTEEPLADISNGHKDVKIYIIKIPKHAELHPEVSLGRPFITKISTYLISAPTLSPSLNFNTSRKPHFLGDKLEMACLNSALNTTLLGATFNVLFE